MSEGVASYFKAGVAELTPFAIGLNKVFFCRPEFHTHYQNRLSESCREMSRKTVEFLGHEVVVFNGYVSLSDILSYSRFGRIGRMVDRLEVAYANLLRWMSACVRG